MPGSPGEQVKRKAHIRKINPGYQTLQRRAPEASEQPSRKGGDQCRWEGKRVKLTAVYHTKFPEGTRKPRKGEN